MFENAVDDCEWDTNLGIKRKLIVSVNGELEGRSFETIFEVYNDDSFEVSSMRWGGGSCSRSERNRILEYIANEY